MDNSLLAVRDINHNYIVADEVGRKMQISSRFTLAVHIFACVDTFKDDYKVTSDFIAGSTNVNPVIIRKILGQA